jgi:hypothetical protein
MNSTTGGNFPGTQYLEPDPVKLSSLHMWTPGEKTAPTLQFRYLSQEHTTTLSDINYVNAVH